MAQDRAFQLLQTRVGLDPELLVEGPPGTPIRLERLCLATASVEGEHQLGPQGLAIGVCGSESLELGDERVLTPEGEVRFDPGFERSQAELLQTRDLALREGLEREVGECRSPPEGEGIAKRRRGAFRLPARDLPPTSLQQSLEAAYVERFWRHAQHVARGLREQELFARSVGEQAPQLREIDVQDRVDRSSEPYHSRAPRSVARAGRARSRAAGERRGERVASGCRAGVPVRPGEPPAARGCGTRDPNAPS